MKPIKICGITNLKDARLVEREGASAIGFIFYKKSPRYIEPEMACKIVNNVKGKISLVGVFVDESLNKIHEISRKVRLDFVQLHGNESSEYCKKVELPVIKAFRIDKDFNQKEIFNFDVHAFLFDTYEKNYYGGTGKKFNWELIRDLKTECPIILSGGLNVQNISDGIKVAMPDALDVNSGVEISPGLKDADKIKSLFHVINDTKSSINPFHVSSLKRGIV